MIGVGKKETEMRGEEMEWKEIVVLKITAMGEQLNLKSPKQLELELGSYILPENKLNISRT